jgi:hypothetical protein
MPSIQERLSSGYSAAPLKIDSGTDEMFDTLPNRFSYIASDNQPGYAVQSSTVLSAPGNPAPVRGIPPLEFVSDSDAKMFFPYSAYSRSRGSVDVNTYIRNLALQALEKAFGQPIV